VEKKGHSRTKDLVPSIGSTSQTLSAPAEWLPVSSPWKPYEGKRSLRIARMVSSAFTSASVTGDWSSLVRTARFF